MPLKLTLAGTGEGRTIEQGTLSIGRASGNDWALADPDRHLSKTHCIIAFAGGRYVLTDVSTNGVFINGAAEPPGRDEEVVLHDGDEIRLGDYTISVTEVSAASRQSARRAGAVPAAHGGRDPFEDARGENGPLLDDPFATPSPSSFAPRYTPPPPPLRRDDPFDRADDSARSRAPDPEDDLFRGSVPTETWQGASQPDNADAPVHAIVAPRVVGPMSLDDIDALLGDEPLGDPAPKPVPPAQAPGEPPAAPPTRRGPPADAARLLAAFYEGAGVPGLSPATDPEVAMREAGMLFRAMVEGLRQVLISRAAIKNEFRIEQTLLRARDNNPLKFAVSDQDAVAALLHPDKPGYKPPLAATQEAFGLLRSHEVAVMAGVQTALMALLRRFEPAALEKRLASGMLDIVPAARRARTWELFCTTYKEIVREAEDDFQAVFGREFARAYQEQAQKL